MMSLYGTLGLLAVLAAAALTAVWLHFRRSRRRGSFPADTWDPYLQKGGQATPWGGGVPDEVEQVAGGNPPAEPEEQYVASRPASDGSVSSRMKSLEAIPISADEERRREEQGRQIEAARAAAPRPPREEEGGEDLLELIASAPGAAPPAPAAPAAKAPVSPPPPARADRPSGNPPHGNGGHRPWWEGLPAPKDSPFRRSVAQLMGIGLAEPSAAPPPPLKPVSAPWSPPAPVLPAESPPLIPGDSREEAPPAGEEDFLGLGPSAGESPPAELPEETPAPAGGEVPVFAQEEEQVSLEAPPGAEAAPDLTPPSGEEASAAEPVEAFLEEEEAPAGAPQLGDEAEDFDDRIQAMQAGSFSLEAAGGAPAAPKEAGGGSFPAGEEIPEGKPPDQEKRPGEEPLLLGEEEALPPGEEIPALLEEGARGGLPGEEPVFPDLPSEDEGETAGAAGERGPILLEELEEEAPPPAAAAPSQEGERAPAAPPAGPAEEEGGADVFAVLRSERGLPEEEIAEAPIGNALLYESNEALENISEQENVAPARARGREPAPPAGDARREEPPPGAAAGGGEEEAVLLEEEPPGPPAARGEEAAPAASSPADLVRKLASDHCPGDLLFAEEGEVRLPAWAEGAIQAAESDLRERQAAKASIQPEELLRLGIVEHLLGRYEEASARFKDALRRARRLGPVLSALAVTTFARGKVDPAVAYCKEAVREAGGDAALRAAIFRNLGWFYQVKGDNARAAEATVSAIEAIGPKGDPAQLSRLHLRAGQLLRRLGETEQARGHLAESAGQFRKAGEEAEWARALVALASAQTQLGESDGALKNLEEAERICRQRGDAAGEALVLGQMGGTYTALDQFTRALGYYEKAVAIHREMGNRKGEAAHMSNIGNIHYFRGDLEEAQAAYERALQINREESHVVGQATSLGNLGRLHLEQGDWERARARLGEARELFKSAGAEEPLEKIRAMLEEVDRAQGR